MSKVQFVANGNTQQIEKFINYVMLDGKKNTARRLVKDTFQIIKDKTKENPTKVFEEAVENVKPSLEVKARRVGGAVYQVPMEVKPKRQFQIACKWIIGAARGKKGAPMSKRLADELIQAFNNEGNAVKKKEDTHRMAQANKAFAHFARY